MKIFNSLSQDHFSIATSTIPKAGQGLFAKRNINEGSTLGFFNGLMLTDQEIDTSPYVHSDYIIWLCRDCNLIAEPSDENYCSYINHQLPANVEMIISTRWKTVRIQALDDIAAGSEIFLDYGEDYWLTHSTINHAELSNYTESAQS